MTLHGLLVLSGFFLLLPSVRAQQEDLMAVISTQLEQLVDQYVDQSLQSHEFSKDSSQILSLFQSKLDDTLQQARAQAVHVAEQKVVKQDRGLHFRSGFGQNLAGSLLEEDGSFYDFRVNAGLDWNLFRDGLVSHKQTLKQKELLWLAEEHLYDQQIRDLSYRKTFDFIIYTFNKKKVELIEKRLLLLDQLTEVASKMFYLKFMQWDNVLDFLSKKKETELFLNNYLTYVESVQLAPAFANLKITNLPVFDFDFDKVEQKGVDTIARFASLENKLMALDHQYHWSKDIDLSTQLRYSYFQGATSSTYQARDFVAVGLTIGLPIPFNRNAKKNLMAAKKADLRTKYRAYSDGLHNELLTHFYEYQYALKQFVHFFYKKERLTVLIDRSMTQKNLEDPGYSPMNVVDKLDELYSVDLEILDIQQKLYLKALKIFTLIGVDDILQFIEIKDYGPDAQKFAIGTSVRCEQADFVDLDVKFLVEYLGYNEIGELLIGTTIEPDLYLKYAELLDRVQFVGADLSVRLALTPDQLNQVGLQKLAEAASFALTRKIHIDLSSFDLIHSQIDHTLYKHITTVITDLSVNFDVSVSLPLLGTEALRKLLYPHVSQLHIVPERSEDLVGLFYLMAGQTAEPFEKIRLTIRPRDFNSRLEMDSFTKELKEHLNLKQVGVSNIGDMLDLERKMVSWHEERGF